ncbi:lytic transglycosylase domain-containing protein [Aquimonas sp.]|jgi:hypothetical protein|uniref:lytic transglycosylase domain-containing protein n=1 Tax=Aquimonas sp. TaxID=1872588 RepID=UPI0037BED076
MTDASSDRLATGSTFPHTVQLGMRLSCFALLAAMIWAAPTSAASEPSVDERLAVHTCIEEAASALEVSPLVLRLLYSLESGRVGHISQWGEGNFDIGPMQINNWWLGRLSEAGITLQELRDRACVNVFVGAWIFKHELERAAGDVALAIARYHSPTPAHQRKYLDRATRHLERMLQDQGIAVATAVQSFGAAQAASTGGVTVRRPQLRSIAAESSAESVTTPTTSAAASAPP